MFKAVQDGKQVAVLVPTTLLAQQHFQTFTDRFAAYPVRVEMLSRFLTPGQAKDVVEGVKTGAVDVVVGTHRLLNQDVTFHDLGLLVVDEEQRFGVKHKERIKEFKADVDVLTLTATPIPRTLEMSLTGIRDMSLLDTPPADRQPILTYVGEYDERAVAEAPDDVGSLTNLGISRTSAGLARGAVSAFEAALAVAARDRWEQDPDLAAGVAAIAQNLESVAAIVPNLESARGAAEL